MGSWLVGVSLPKMCIIVQMSNCCQSNMGKVMVDGQDRDDRQDTGLYLPSSGMTFDWFMTGKTLNLTFYITCNVFFVEDDKKFVCLFAMADILQRLWNCHLNGRSGGSKEMNLVTCGFGKSNYTALTIFHCNVFLFNFVKRKPNWL